MAWFVLLSLLASAPSRSELVLQWDAPAACPGAATIRARISEQWGEREVVPIEAHGVITQTPDREPGWRLVLQVRAGAGETGERVVEAHDCDALADAAVLVLAVAATTATPPLPPTEIPVPPPEAPASEPLPPAPATAPITVVQARPIPEPAPKPKRRPVAAELAIAGGFDAAAMPGLGGSITASVGVRIAWLGVHAFALHGIRRAVQTGSVEARHWLTSGGLAVCGLAPIRSFDVGGCAKGELGGLRSRGTRGVMLHDSTQLWAAVSLGGQARWRFARRWALALSADAVAPLVRRTFDIGAREVGRTGIVGVRVLAGLVVRLGPRDFAGDPGNQGPR